MLTSLQRHPRTEHITTYTSIVPAISPEALAAINFLRVVNL